MKKLLTLALPLVALATFSSAGIAQQTAPLTVKVSAGAGSGTVTSNPAGIVCGTACTQSYSVGVAVVLLAQPDPGSVFGGWSGDCTGAASRTSVTMTAPTSGTGKICVATFNAAPPVALTAIKAGVGSGTVTSNPAGIVCGTACTQSYSMGIAVMLLAQPDPGSVFAGWIGDCTGTAPSTSVTMTSPTSGTGKSCVATFNAAPPVTLTAAKSGTGSGAVTSSPAGIACGATCAQSYATGIAVTLTAAPDPGSVFAGWSGACTGAASSTSVTMSVAKSCMATFNAAPSVTLTTSKAGTGSGTVTSFPPGIGCGAPPCTAVYPTGTVVVLTASPDPGSVFAGWSGACAGTAPGTSVTMSAAKSCAATFNAAPSVTLTATKSGTGSGTVTSSPAGIACGATCAAGYPMGAAVTLTAAPEPSSVFAGWSGACTGTAPGTSVTMTAAKSCTATFNAAPSVTLTATKAGTGSGTVTSSPAGIACGATCAQSYATGIAVTLTAAPDPGSMFAGWSGACAGTATATSVTMSAAKTCTATFNAAPPVALTATKAGTGSGTVTSSPAGIACGATCAQSYSTGIAVTLTAAPDPGSVFAGWSGACTGTAPGTSVTMSAAKSCTAQFDQANLGKCDLVVSKSPTTGTTTPLVSGQQVAFEIIVKNQGTGTCLAHIPVIDTFAAGLTYASGGASGWVCPKWHTIGPNSAVCTNSEPLAPGQGSLLVVTFDVTAPPPTVIKSCATARNADDTNLANNKACVQLEVAPRRPIDCRPPMVPNAAGRTCVCPPGTMQKGRECAPGARLK